MAHEKVAAALNELREARDAEFQALLVLRRASQVDRGD
jgi:hypothetical protein